MEPRVTAWRIRDRRGEILRQQRQAVLFRCRPGVLQQQHERLCGLPANFALYSNRGGTIATSSKLVSASANGRYNDDAVYPIQKATFATINGVAVSLIGSCPWALSDTNKMNYPCALFEFVLTNTLATPVDVAIGFQLTDFQHTDPGIGHGIHGSNRKCSPESNSRNNHRPGRHHYGGQQCEFSHIGSSQQQHFRDDEHGCGKDNATAGFGR